MERAMGIEPTSEAWEDRKSTRLNSSHGYISYAVFCLKKIHRRYLAAFTLITRTASCSRQLPSCVAVYPRDFPIVTCSMPLIPFAPFLRDYSFYFLIVT